MSVPYDHDAESAVIGCCLFGSSDAVRWAVDWLAPGDFHVPSHAHVFAAVVELFKDGSRVDNVTIVDRMTRNGTIRETTRSELNAALSNTPAVSAITRYGEIVQRHSLARAGLRLTSDAVAGLQDQTKDPAMLVDRLRADLASIDSPIALRDPGDVTLAQLRSEPLEQRSPWVMEGLMRRDWRATLVGVEGSGKLLRVDEPIATPCGWSTMGLLRPGDEVFDRFGKPTEVVAVTDVDPFPDARRVVFDDGAWIECDTRHLWLTVDYRSREKGHHEAVQRTTAEIASTLKARDGFCANHAVPVAEPLELTDIPVRPHPYTLGVWLGDGSSRGAIVFLNRADADHIEARIRTEGYATHRVPSVEKPNCVGVRISGLIRELRERGLIEAKSIPDDYLRAGTGQRRALLEGLMDTDGYVSDKGSRTGRGAGMSACEICFMTKALVPGVLELLRTLGVKVNVHESDATLEGRVVGRRWRMAFASPSNPFSTPRKADRWRPLRTRRAQYRYVTAVESVEPTPMRCIQVASPDGSYLAGLRMIPTHNSILLRALAVCAAYGTQPFTGVATKPCRSLLIDLENPKDHLQDWVERIADTCEHMGRSADDRMSIWHRPGGIDLRRRTDRGELADILRRRKPDVVCLGPLYKAYRRSSSESDEQVASEVQDVLDDLRTRHSFGLVLEHHAPKAQGGTRPLDPFGSSLWLRWGEIRMSLVPPSKDFPVMSLKLKPFSGSRVEHAWPDEIHRGRFRLDLPWVGKPGRLAAEEAI